MSSENRHAVDMLEGLQTLKSRFLTAFGMTKFGFSCALLLLALAGAVDADTPAQPEPASGFAPRPAVTGARFMAVTANAYATGTAVDILKAGGSAVDAAIAAQLVLNLVEPQSSGIGGGGFLLHYAAAQNKLRAYDGRETAPQAARPQRFLDATDKPLPFYAAATGGHAVGTPGLLALLALAHQQHGRLPWQRLFAPAITLAEEGFLVSPRLHALLLKDKYLLRNEAARAYFYQADGKPVSAGSRLRNPELATVLQRIANEGSGAFYQGELAREMVAAVAAQAGGNLSMADLAHYQAVEREPLCGNYREYKICGMPPPSSGAVTLLQMLKMLERLPLAAEPPASMQSVHWFSEAGRLAYADRSRYLADPDFANIPLRGLLDDGYLAARSKLIRDDTSMGRAQPGQPPQSVADFADDDAEERPATTHLSIVDAEGSAVALTSSIEDAFGSRIMLHGFLLNNQLTDFAFLPQQEGKLVANRVEPGKRPLSSMAPTLVFDASGKLLLVLGSPGGGHIINYVAQTLVALLDWKMEAAAALALPHFGSRNGPTDLEHGRAAESLAPLLRARGHEVNLTDMTSGVHLVQRSNQGWIGAADTRREGVARGE